MMRGKTEQVQIEERGWGEGSGVPGQRRRASVQAGGRLSGHGRRGPSRAVVGLGSEGEGRGRGPGEGGKGSQDGGAAGVERLPGAETEWSRGLIRLLTPKGARGKAAKGSKGASKG